MKGKTNPALIVAVVLIVSVSVVAILVSYGISLSALRVTPTIEYDGEFDDAYLATEYGFYADFVEQKDCNITSDVLGGSSYSACIYNSTAPGFIANQSTKEWEFDIVIDIDGPVEKMEVDINLQNTGTLQAQDDVVLKDVALYRYEKGALLSGPIKQFDIDDNNYQVDDETGPLSGDEYVLKMTYRTKAINPNAATGDDIAKINLDLTTDGDTDAARILVESH